VLAANSSRRGPLLRQRQAGAGTAEPFAVFRIGGAGLTTGIGASESAAERDLDVPYVSDLLEVDGCLAKEKRGSLVTENGQHPVVGVPLFETVERSAARPGSDGSAVRRALLPQLLAAAARATVP